ncbi:FAD-dependent oxidoreductase [Allochromatium vinosum]|uniref:FAD-dependent oxidoreductase n=1 Tax=Allochromatium vinosum TaxID=1049 RepID=UPI00190667A2|nr:FAD-dependent oxidoreductase [Allochromatium vinosum]MBK1656097.1 hypothetical protein [Allochromatium vinosum]
MNRYDVVILGAGLFGMYAALHYEKKGSKVLLVDSETRPCAKASIVNQARIHTGYHYPRSMLTARMAHGYRSRFIDEHEFAINNRYTCYYAIDNRGSLTSAPQMQRFCNKLNIPLRKTYREDLFDHNRFEALFEAEEFSFDPLLIRNHYLNRIQHSSIETLFGWKPVSVSISDKNWIIDLQSDEGLQQTVCSPAAFNVTYANINAVNRIFGLEEIPVTHEISEIGLVYSERLSNVGLTVMDGPYISIMPFGLSGLHSITSVLYTHIAYSTTNDPKFECQSKNSECTPTEARACTYCRFRPPSNIRKMVRQADNYLVDDIDIHVHGSIYTIKTKLQSALFDDGRPTVIQTYRQKPFFGVIFSGKINSIYEIERVEFNA